MAYTVKKVTAVSGVNGAPGKIINTYQPAGRVEEFFQAVSQSKNLPTREHVLNNSYTAEHKQIVHELFRAHGMEVVGPPLIFPAPGE